MPTDQRKHASREEAEMTKRTILRVAQELFMEYGFRAVTTRQIADACGLSQPALYHYFGDKQALYVAMALEELAKTKTALERIVRRNENVEELLKRATLYLVASTQHDINLMLHDIRHELAPEAQSTLNEAFEMSIIRPIASIFEDGLRKGQLLDQQHGGVEPVTATYFMMSLLSNLVMRNRMGDRSSNNGDQVKLVIRVLLYGLANSATPS